VPLEFPRAVIFDWDNTLVDNWPVIADAINATFQKYNMPVWSLEEVKQRCNRAAHDSFPDWFGVHWREAHDFFYARFEAIHLDKLEKLPGAEDLLRWLHAAKIPLFVVSNKRGDYLRQQAAALGWDKLIIALIGSQDAAQDKPARDPVDLALARAGLQADQSVWFVGDTALDMQCAKNAGCLAVLVGKSPDNAELDASLTISDCHALKSLLNNLYNKEHSR